MASTKDRQRALERARYERVQAKIVKQRAAAVRRRRIAMLTAVAVLLLGGGIAGAVFATSSSPAATPVAKSSASASPSAAAVQPTASVTGCTAPAGAAPKPQSYTSEPAMTIDKAAAYKMTIKTNCGSIVVALDAAKAPHTVNSFSFLAGKGYFADTYCHRLTTSGIYVLQCGDPTASPTSGGSGGPGYKLPDENLTGLGTGSSVTYPAGEIAMANSGANTGGSQFFLVYKDSPLPPSYTPFGKITSGLDILQRIATAGSTNSNGSGDGNPMQKVQIESVTVAAS